MRGPTTSSSVLFALHQGQATSPEWVSPSHQTLVSLPSESFIFMGTAPGHHIHPTPLCSGTQRAQRGACQERPEWRWRPCARWGGGGGVFDVGLAMPVLPPTPGLPGNRTDGLWALGARVGQRGGQGQMWGS